MLKMILLIWTALSCTSLANAQNGVPDKLGVVSYTFRNSFSKNFTATLDTVRSMGINNIEFSNLFGLTAEKIRAELDLRGMYCTSFGVSYDDALNKTAEVGKNAKALGAKFVRVAWIPHTGPFTKELAEKAVRDFNQIGSFLNKEFGLSFCYHNHGYEFIKDGDGTLFNYIVEKTDPAFVNFELDILWAHLAEADPVQLLERYPNRFYLIHLKDLKTGTAHTLSGTTDPSNDVALGTGEIDIPAVMDASQKSSIRYFYIEDESPAATKQLPESVKYMKRFSLQPK